MTLRVGPMAKNTDVELEIVRAIAEDVSRDLDWFFINTRWVWNEDVPRWIRWLFSSRLVRWHRDRPRKRKPWFWPWDKLGRWYCPDPPWDKGGSNA